jgi:hypothetical protein
MKADSASLTKRKMGFLSASKSPTMIIVASAPWGSSLRIVSFRMIHFKSSSDGQTADDCSPIPTYTNQTLSLRTLAPTQSNRVINLLPVSDPLHHQVSLASSNSLMLSYAVALVKPSLLLLLQLTLRPSLGHHDDLL